MEFKDYLAGLTQDIENIIYSFLPEEKEYSVKIRQAMNYSVKNGGKRLRPVFMWLTYKMLGGDKEYVNCFMSAIEMIHSYSLVHDDLPAMDNDELRRGKPTTWKQYGHAEGILAGDGLLNLAYETSLKAFEKASDEDIKDIAAANRILASKAGIDGMVGGQAADVVLTGKSIDYDTLCYIYKLKTCALIEASFMIGGALAKADETAILRLEEIGTNLGMAFQIQDDILDIYGDEVSLGKPLHSDEKNDKTTYVSLFGYERAKQYVEEYSQKAVGLLNTFPENEYREYLNELFVMLINRSK